MSKRFLATYDIRRLPPASHTAFLASAERRGWFHWIADSAGIKYRLPNTTLDGWFDSYPQAWAAFRDSALEAQRLAGPGFVIEKWIIAEQSDTHFDSDVKRAA
ncbi:MAG: hypothetical protein ABL879_14080 [Devosia sp.]